CRRLRSSAVTDHHWTHWDGRKRTGPRRPAREAGLTNEKAAENTNHLNAGVVFCSGFFVRETAGYASRRSPDPSSVLPVSSRPFPCVPWWTVSVSQSPTTSEASAGEVAAGDHCVNAIAAP